MQAWKTEPCQGSEAKPAVGLLGTQYQGVLNMMMDIAVLNYYEVASSKPPSQLLASRVLSCTGHSCTSYLSFLGSQPPRSKTQTISC